MAGSPPRPGQVASHARLGAGTDRLRGRTVAMLFAAGLLVNLGFLFLYHFPEAKRLIGDEMYYFAHGARIADGRRTPYAPVWPPLYGEFIGLLLSTFGSTVVAVQVAQIALWLASAWLFGAIVARVFPSRMVVGSSLVLFLFSPESVAFSHYLWPETLHQFFWLLALWALICRRRDAVAAALAGGALGAALLTKLLLKPFIPVVAIFTLCRGSGAPPRATRFAHAALVGITAMALVVPIMLVNLRTRGEFILADTSVLNLWIGLNDRARVDFRDDIAGRELDDYLRAGKTLAARNAVFRARILEKVRSEGWSRILTAQLSKQYFRLFDRQTFFTTQLPGGGREAYAPGRPRTVAFLRLYSLAVYGFVLIAGMAGTCFVRLTPVGWPQFFVAFIAYNLLMLLFLHVKTRFVMQFFPLLMFFAAVSMTAFGGRRSVAAPAGFAFTRARMLAGLLVGTLMTSFIFGSVWFDPAPPPRTSAAPPNPAPSAAPRRRRATRRCTRRGRRAAPVPIAVPRRNATAQIPPGGRPAHRVRGARPSNAPSMANDAGPARGALP